jgi:hypothetical protein
MCGPCGPSSKLPGGLLCPPGDIDYTAAMPDFKSQILRHRDMVNELHGRIRASIGARDRSEAHERAWKAACAEFHGYRSEIHGYMDQVSAKTLAEGGPIRRFVFDYLHVDPMYFRSGYEKERLLRLLKSIELADEEKAVLRETILRRVRNGAFREFRRFCQLIPKLQDDAFVAELRAEAESADMPIRRRASFALHYTVR